MNKISVIVPIYNVELYLRKCLDSIVGQTYKNLEIILIDDGSPDNCGVICDEYAAKDDRITVIHKKNGGLTRAWNDGLKIASGEWIAFVDSDDWLELGYFEEMVKHLTGVTPDILQAGGYFEESDRGQQSVKLLDGPVLFENGDGREYFMCRTLVSERVGGELLGSLVYVWTKLYRSEFIKNNALLFDPLIRAGLGCDGLFNFQAFSMAKTVMGSQCVGYHYRRTEESGTLRYGPDRPEAVHYILERLHEHMKRTTSSELVAQAIDAYAISHIRVNLSKCFFHPDNKESYNDVMRGIKKMKQMPYYRKAIYSGRNPFLPRKKEILKLILRTPFVWPLKAIAYHSRG